MTIEYERQFRLLMDAGEWVPAKNLFLVALGTQDEATLPAPIANALNWAGAIEYSHGAVQSEIYLNHPLRVATLLAEQPGLADAETLAMALIHNVLEVSPVTSTQVEKRLGRAIAEGVDALTVNRTQQYEPSYKHSYYMRIEATSPNCARVKAADKLDNIYMLCFNPDAGVRSQYLDEIDKLVIPMADRTAPALAARLRTASSAMRCTGFLEKNQELQTARKRYTK